MNTNPKNPDEVTSFSMLSGSLSPLGTGTSRFRVYDLNEESFEIKNYFDYEMKLNEESFALNYDFRKYYEIDEQSINSSVMRKLQEKMESDAKYRKKYANELNGRENNNLKAYCQTYDSQAKISECLNNQLTFSMQIF